MSKSWKLATQKEIDCRDGLIKIKDYEGLRYEHQDMMKKYLRRPSDLEEICSSQFAIHYIWKEMIKNDKENERDENEPNEKDDDDEQKFHFITNN